MIHSYNSGRDNGRGRGRGFSAPPLYKARGLSSRPYFCNHVHCHITVPAVTIVAAAPTLNMLSLPLYKPYKEYFKLKEINMFDQGGANTNGVVIHEAMKTY